MDVIHFTYPCTITTQYIVTFISLNRNAPFRYIKDNKNEIFYFTLIYFLLTHLFFSGSSNSLTYILFFLLEELLTFIERRSPGDEFPQFGIFKKVFISPSVFKNNFPGYRILSWWGVSFHSLLVCTISDKMSE